MENSVLAHHGIKGMKWGVRRYQNKDGTLTAAGKRRAAKESKLEDREIRKSRKQDIKNRRKLSPDEIRKKIERLKLEKELKSLTEENIAPGKKFVSDSMQSAGKKALATAAAGTMAYAVKVAMTKEFNIKDAAAYIAANPNKKK